MPEKKPSRFGHQNPKLVVWVEAEKSSPRGESLLCWHLKRLSLTLQAVAVDYDVNSPKGGVPSSGIVSLVCGKNIVKALTGVSFVKYKYMKVMGRPIWLSQGFEFGLVNASENYEISRVMFLAAQQAGLEPKIDFSVEQFQHFIKKLK